MERNQAGDMMQRIDDSVSRLSVTAMMLFFGVLVGPAVGFLMNFNAEVVFILSIALGLCAGVVYGVARPAAQRARIHNAVCKWVHKELKHSQKELCSLAVGANADGIQNERELRLRIARHLAIKYIVKEIKRRGLLATRLCCEAEFTAKVDTMVMQMSFHPLSRLISILK